MSMKQVKKAVADLSKKVMALEHAAIKSHHAKPTKSRYDWGYIDGIKDAVKAIEAAIKAEEEE